MKSIRYVECELVAGCGTLFPGIISAENENYLSVYPQDTWHDAASVSYIIVTGFAKRGLSHTSNLRTLVIHNFRLEKGSALKFGQ